MKKHLLASAAILAVAAASSAGAADLPMKARAPYVAPAPVFTWTGCYVGGHVGYGWSKPRFADHNASSFLIDTSGFGRSVQGKSNGGIFGGQIGCDYQFNGNFVIGISGSASGASMTGTTFNPFNDGDFGPISAKTNWLADISGRIGYAFGDSLLYVKGGVAWVNTDYNYLRFGDESTSFGGTTTGALAGVGFEHYILPNWTIFAEYNHYFFNSKTFTTGAENPGFLVDVKQDIDVVKVGVNWRFNNLSAPIAARY
jgi:outer membrane immunogenic protein